MTTPIAATFDWVGPFLRGEAPDEGAALAARVLGDDGMAALRAHFEQASADELEAQRVGALHACIWMVQADREVADAEARVLDALIAHSELPWARQQQLIAAIAEPRTPEALAEELTQPQLRELMLGLLWRIALADGRLDDEESDAHARLSAAFGVDEARAAAIRDAVVDD